ncbi:cilia- and flagella-associated protein 44-like isoform X1 [Montipora capricornis]|uniref:cilia- and flagella-associated protein 44-like isoform X1 n=1 Tax=Montipora capricornis TaxID=246305 RepID=UPI0035F129D0
MSDKLEGSDITQGSQDQEKEDTSKPPALKEATHKLKAEALRRLQLQGGDYESESVKLESAAGQDSSENAKSDLQNTNDEDDQRGTQATKSDVLVSEKDNDVNTGVDENKENGSSIQNFLANQNDYISEGSVGNVHDITLSRPENEENKQGFDVSTDEGNHKGFEVNENIVTKGHALQPSQDEKAGPSTSRKISNDGSIPTDQANEGQKGVLQGSRPSSGAARAGSEFKGYVGGEKGHQKPSSRPGSGKSTSRPGSGMGETRQEQRQSSSRPSSRGHSGSRPKSGSTQPIVEIRKDRPTTESANIDGTGFVDGKSQLRGVDSSPEERMADETTTSFRKKEDFEEDNRKYKSSNKPVGEQLATKDQTAVVSGKKTLNFGGENSQSEEKKGDVSISMADTKTSPLRNISEGASQTLPVVGNSVKQGKDPHSDTEMLAAVDDKSGDVISKQMLSKENDSDSRQTQDDDNTHYEVSPPVNESVGFQGEGCDSKQSSDSSSYKQDSKSNEDRTDDSKGEPASTTKGDIKKASSSDQVGGNDITFSEQEDPQKATQGKGGFKEEKTAKDQGKVKEPDSEKGPEADLGETKEVYESKKSRQQTDQGIDDKGQNEGSSSQESSKGDVVSRAGQEKLYDDNEQKKTMDDSTKEGTDQEGDVKERKDKEGEESGKALDEPPTTRTKQDISDDEETERILPDDFYYEFDDLVSRAFTTEEIPSQLLSFHHSFGYECTKRSNLHVLDESSVLFSAGNTAEILNLKTQDQTHIRTTGGGGIGAIAVHPSRKYFAVAEKGIKPNVNIFEFPSLKLHRILREGTEEAYANLDFSPKGDKLASVGSAPDYMLTVWDWKNEQVILRSKAFSQDIYKVAFSPEDEGHLCTSGSGHIRFWTMANTFTGLKLQGQIGKFGAKELSDIEGFVELPDGKVLSGSEWGNMLLWDGGLIKVEISKKGRKPCHVGMIEQFFMDEGELMTIGADGFVKVWDFESIDNADTTEEGQLFEMDPMYELKVGTDVKLMSMVKAVNTEAPIWYAQDAAGGIWKLDLSFTHTSHVPERMFSYHAGPITGLDTSPVAHFVATTGVDRTVRVYDYVSKTPMCRAKYNAGGSSLLWVPKKIDSRGTKLLAGFDDGVVRLLALNKVDPSQLRTKKTKLKHELNLEHVFKPHTKSVNVLTIDQQGELLATGSDDCTVFFFTVGEIYKPIGFIETAAPVVSLEWTKKGKDPHSILVGCRDGTVLHVEAPAPGKYDTSKTYHLPLTNLKTKEYHFTSVKEKLRKAEEEARKAKEEEEMRKKKEEERARRRARGLEDEEEEQEEEEKKDGVEGEEEQKEEEVTEEEQHREPGQIIKGFYYGNTDKFWVSMDGWDAGYLYECEFDEGKKPAPAPGQEDTRDEPVRSIPVDNSDDKPIRSVCFSHSGKFLLLGMDNGVVRIHPLDGKLGLEHLSSYWALNVHDNQHGGIKHIKTSFDDKYIFTAGMDGNFFVFKFMDQAVKGLKVAHRVSIPSPKKLIGEEGEEIVQKIDDIDDPNHYSIELEKQKAEHDRMVKLAEDKKQNIRRKIGNLRRAFKELMNKNHKLPQHVQITPDEFEIDPDLIKEQKVEVSKKIELVRKEMAWQAEKYTIGLKKLQKRFKDNIECERIVLRAFLSPHLVTTFRASKPDDFYQLLQEAVGAGGGEGPDGGGAGRKSFVGGAKIAALMKKRGTIDKLPTNQQQQQQAPLSQGQLGSKVATALAKAEARRQKRLARQAEWDELYRNKPDEDYQDPKDVAAIKEARENMGDYKLKTAKDYVVPESQRVNAEKKRIQLLNLLDQIHQYKFEFNQSFLALREKKIKIIREMKETVAKLEEVQRKIDPYSKRPIPKIPEMMPDECPEKRLEYTRERLLEFKKQLDEKVGEGHSDEHGGGFGGFGGFGGGGTEPSKHVPHGNKPGTQPRDRSISSVSVHSSGRPKSSLSTLTDKGTPEPPIEEVSEEPSPLEQQLQYEEQMRLQYEQDVLIDKINNTLEKFDADLRYLRHEKMHLEIAVKCADLRQVTLFEEFMLLKEFEKRENSFANKVNTKLSEKEEMQEKVEDCQMKLDSKKQDIEKLQEQEKALYSTFSAALGENNKFEPFLTRVFKKKIKRAKKKTQTEEGSDDESEDEDSDEDLSSSDEEDSDNDDLDDSVCPPGCDPALFDQVCQLRERRLDLEEEVAEEKKTSETLKKEYDALVKKAKVIDSALKTAEADLEAFQREKQQKLNELDVVVVLKLHQIQYMVNSVLPQDLSQCLVFNSPGLVRLQSRIKELEKEKAEQKRLYREHRQTHVQLIRDKKVQEARISELEEKVRNMLMLKFGRLVDLEKLETVTVNRTLEELKEKLRQQESKSAAEIAKWDSKIVSYKGKVTQLTRENTQRLDTYTVLLQEKKELEQMLNSRQKSLGSEFSGSRKADIRERQRLVQLVQLQAQEIDALKDEITLLSRKGGHILPPAQPPLPPGQTPIPNQ